MRLIVGLGNPGTKYAATRHNFGFRVIDELARQCSIDTTQEKFHAWAGLGTIHEERVVLLKPTTFMNRSGQAVLAAGRFYRIELSELLVICDDFALPLGCLRLREHGSAGSHNGLTDIVTRLGSEAFARLRLGIGDALGDPVRFVLERFSSDEEAVVARVVARASDAVEHWVTHGSQATMNRYNGMIDEAGSNGAS